ncbi:hypothetical protein J5N97_026096 [Dioscorea zingiberensis]|uniref:Uncharacterized protein n=1 Tax=Dioscorea zingiberensis TaxID=325984 RepID=A0A9D5C2D1_9LILI|nr:hypothetical protein J5N97_026096 [Dioscorea zingiberensis]
MPRLLLHSPPVRLPPLFFPQSLSPCITPHSILFPRAPIIARLPVPHLPNRALPITDVDLLDALAGSSDDEPKAHLPAVRSYQNDLARLTLIGAVGADHALTAAAADGGEVADEHLASGAATMVVETVFPSSSDERSTVSTRLFLPAKRVKEKAKKLRGSLSADMLFSDGTISKNILAITFRQVVLQRLWTFELSIFRPESKRNMQELAEPKDDPIDFSVSAADEGFLSALAEVVCSFALDKTKRDHIGEVDRSAANSLLTWFNKPQMMASVDSSIFLYKISPEDIVKSARKQVMKFNLAKGNLKFRKRNMRHFWWSLPTYSRLDKDMGPSFTDWANEHIPAYRIQIDGNKFCDAKLHGWKKLANNRWEVFLTNFQMVELASILDMFYEDRFTLPDKELFCGIIKEYSSLSKNKSSWKIFLVSLAVGCFAFSISILAQLCLPHVLRAGKTSKQITLNPSASTTCSQIQSLEAFELEAMCLSVVRKIKDALCWPGDVVIDKNIGAWTGTVPSYLKIMDYNVFCAENSEINAPHGDVPAHEASPPSESISVGTSNSDIHMTASDIASYEVVLSRDGEIIGFQPTNRVAVNRWASNPLVKILYKRQKLAPGIFEPSPKISQPQETVLIELLMSEKPESCFALARPSRDDYR